MNPPPVPAFRDVAPMTFLYYEPFVIAQLSSRLFVMRVELIERRAASQYIAERVDRLDARIIVKMRGPYLDGHASRQETRYIQNIMGVSK